MTKDQLQQLYSQELLVEAVVEPSIQHEGWIVEFRHARGGLVPMTDRLGVEICFESADMATVNALDVGFRQVRIVDEV